METNNTPATVNANETQETAATKILNRYELLNSNDTPRFQYMILGRCQADCDYFLGYGCRYEGQLWTGNAVEQIKVMRALWLWLPEKPEWLTMEQINEYAKHMIYA